MIGFTLLVFKLIVTGDIGSYIAPRMMPYIYIAFIIMFLLSLVQFTRVDEEDDCGCDHNHGYTRSFSRSIAVYMLFLIPLLVGFLFSDYALGSSLANQKGFKYNLQTNVTNQSSADMYNEVEDIQDELLVIDALDMYPTLYKVLLEQKTISIDEDSFIGTISVLEADPASFVGKEVELSGFVFREEDLTNNELIVGRFGMTCCVADSSIFGLIVEGETLNSFKDDQWVTVKGTIKVKEYNGWTLPSLSVSNITLIDEPDTPYVYENLEVDDFRHLYSN